MIRKQLYIGEKHEQKLRELAAKWECSEAEVVRRAIEELTDAEKSLNEQINERLEAAGIIEPRRHFPDLPKDPEERRRQREELERMIASHEEPIGLSEAVIEDRR